MSLSESEIKNILAEYGKNIIYDFVAHFHSIEEKDHEVLKERINKFVEWKLNQPVMKVKKDS
jgi:hypothetical protein